MEWHCCFMVNSTRVLLKGSRINSNLKWPWMLEQLKADALKCDNHYWERQHEKLPVPTPHARTGTSTAPTTSATPWIGTLTQALSLKHRWSLHWPPLLKVGPHKYPVSWGPSNFNIQCICNMTWYCILRREGTPSIVKYAWNFCWHVSRDALSKLLVQRLWVSDYGCLVPVQQFKAISRMPRVCVFDIRGYQRETSIYDSRDLEYNPTSPVRWPPYHFLFGKNIHEEYMSKMRHKISTRRYIYWKPVRQNGAIEKRRHRSWQWTCSRLVAPTPVSDSALSHIPFSWEFTRPWTYQLFSKRCFSW